MDKMIITFAQERFLGDPTFRALVSWLMGSMRDRYVRSVELCGYQHKRQQRLDAAYVGNALVE
jgi:hypothetical protein